MTCPDSLPAPPYVAWHVPTPLPGRDDIRACFVANLRRALGPATRLFDRQLRDGRWAPTLGTEDLTSTAICLLGIDRAGASDDVLADGASAVFDVLLRATAERGYAGAAGLVLWVGTVLERGPAQRLLEAMDCAGLARANAGFADALTTMELAWLVSGAAHAHAHDRLAGTAAIVAAGLAELAERLVPDSGLFLQCGARAPWRHRFRREVSSFADQIYPIQALAFAILAGLDVPAALDGAALARGLAARQGAGGQWWWHYHPRSGAVLQRYPVFSVHQLSMVPMAFDAVRRAYGLDLSAAIDRGRRWCDGSECGHGMWDIGAGTVWRDLDITRGRVGGLTRKALSVVAPSGDSMQPPTPESLRLNRETRPYEWGWWLYANAAATATDSGRHLG